MTAKITTARDAIDTVRAMSAEIERINRYLTDHTDAHGPDAFWLGSAHALVRSVENDLLLIDATIGRTTDKSQ